MKTLLSILLLGAFALPTQAQCRLDSLSGAGIGQGDGFGSSVAITIDDDSENPFNDFVIVGASQDDSTFTDSGSAFISQRHSDDGWFTSQQLTASDAGFGNVFGYSVGIDQTTAIVGAPGNNSSAGAAYIFDFNGTSWSETIKLVGLDTTDDDQFGIASSIDGFFAVVGAPTADLSAGLGAEGAAYVFTSNPTWQQNAKLTASDAAPLDTFGASVANTPAWIAVGAPGEAGGGAVYMYQFNGLTFVEVQKLDGAADTSSGDFFGTAVALSEDLLVVGSVEDNYSGFDDAGSAYVFQLQLGTWVEIAKLTPASATDDLRFGRSVGVSVESDLATTVVVGADQFGTTGPGMGFLFRDDGTGTLVEIGTMNPFGIPAPGGEYGTGVAVDRDYAVVGGPDSGGVGQGEANIHMAQSCIGSTRALLVDPSINPLMFDRVWLNLCMPDSGLDNYLVLGSLTGTSPGFPLTGTLTLPLIVDSYFILTLNNPNQGFLQDTLGVLDSEGQGRAWLVTVPGLLPPSAVGLRLYHAALAFDAVGTFTGVTSAVPTDLQ